jgi:predicted flap endonuclease-1-like 5' DNA nuclease
VDFPHPAIDWSNDVTKMTPLNMTPDFSPAVKLVAYQTRVAIETSQEMMKMAMLPWQMMMGASVSQPAPAKEQASAVAKDPAKGVTGTPKVDVAPAKPVSKAALVETKTKPAPVTKPTAKVEKPAVALKSDAVAQPKPEAVAKPAPVATTKPAAAAKPEPAAKPAVAAKVEPAAQTKPAAVQKAEVAPKVVDDLTALKGVGPKLAQALQDAGVTSYAQIAKWGAADIAWADENIAGARGRAVKNDWVAQAASLSK